MISTNTEQLGLFSKVIYVAIISSILGFYITFHVVNCNLIQRGPINNYVIVTTEDESLEGNYYEFPIISNYPSPIEHKTRFSDNDSDTLLFNANPSFLIWLMLLCIMMAIAFGSLPIFIGYIINIYYLYKLSVKNILFSLILILILGCFLALTNNNLHGYYQPGDVISDMQILLKNGNLIVWIAIIFYILLSPVIMVMLLTIPAAKNSLETCNTHDDILLCANKFQKINQILQNTLQLLAIIVALSVLTSSTLRISIKSLVSIDEKYNFDIFPREASYVYGMYFSLFLGIIYFPTYHFLKYCSSILTKRFYELKENNHEQNFYDSALKKVDIQLSSVENYKIAFTVLSPFLSSFLPDLVNLITKS